MAPGGKRRVSGFAVALVLIAALVAAAGCSQRGTFTFTNSATSRVLVQPNGQHWPQFLLDPGDVRTVTLGRDEVMIYFVYMDANVVSAETKDGQVIFSDNKKPGQ